MIDPHKLSATQAAAAIRAGRLTSESLVEACLAQIERREPEINAWAHYDADAALQQARACDKAAPGSLGPLHGIPVGIKDVLDTVDMPTGYNSPIYQGHQPAWDAACVAATRLTGGVILGKTVTTEFANSCPSQTRNPHNPDHTPGGSSSGSAAAVADFMVPLAVATQTGGSTIRPAAFCGVVGYKPSFGTINRAGLKFVAESLDTIGVIARSVDDSALYVHAVSGRDLPDFNRKIKPPKIGFCRTPHWDQADAATQALLEATAVRLARAGAEVRDVELSPEIASTYDEQSIVMYFETARALAYEFKYFPEKISPNLRRRIEEGWNYPYARYETALQRTALARQRFTELMGEYDILLSPSARGEAPQGLQTTGDSVFNRSWTLLGTPSVTIPCGTGPSDLPIGVQVSGAYNTDSVTLSCAHWAWHQLN